MLRLTLKLAILPLAYVLAAAIAIVLFIWAGIDLWVALIVVSGGLLLLAWYMDRKDKSRGAGR